MIGSETATFSKYLVAHLIVKNGECQNWILFHSKSTEVEHMSDHLAKTDYRHTWITGDED